MNVIKWMKEIKYPYGQLYLVAIKQYIDMKTQSNNCLHDEFTEVLPNLYECKRCGTIFSSIKNSGLYIKTKGITTIQVVNLKGRDYVKQPSRPRPGIIVGLGKNGINNKYLNSLIMNNSNLTLFQKRDVVKRLDLK
jgi:hypothetical protein